MEGGNRNPQERLNVSPGHQAWGMHPRKAPDQEDMTESPTESQVRQAFDSGWLHGKSNLQNGTHVVQRQEMCDSCVNCHTGMAQMCEAKQRTQVDNKTNYFPPTKKAKGGYCPGDPNTLFLGDFDMYYPPNKIVDQHSKIPWDDPPRATPHEGIAIQQHPMQCDTHNNITAINQNITQEFSHANIRPMPPPYGVRATSYSNITNNTHPRPRGSGMWTSFDRMSFSEVSNATPHASHFHGVDAILRPAIDSLKTSPKKFSAPDSSLSSSNHVLNSSCRNTTTSVALHGSTNFSIDQIMTSPSYTERSITSATPVSIPLTVTLPGRYARSMETNRVYQGSTQLPNNSGTDRSASCDKLLDEVKHVIGDHNKNPPFYNLVKHQELPSSVTSNIKVKEEKHNCDSVKNIATDDPWSIGHVIHVPEGNKNNSSEQNQGSREPTCRIQSNEELLKSLDQNKLSDSLENILDTMQFNTPSQASTAMGTADNHINDELPSTDSFLNAFLGPPSPSGEAQFKVPISSKQGTCSHDNVHSVSCQIPTSSMSSSGYPGLASVSATNSQKPICLPPTINPGLPYSSVSASNPGMLDTPNGAIPIDQNIVNNLLAGGTGLADKSPSIVRNEIPPCNCLGPEVVPSEEVEGPYYTQLGFASSVAGIRTLMEARFKETGDAVRIEKVLFTGKKKKVPTATLR